MVIRECIFNEIYENEMMYNIGIIFNKKNILKDIYFHDIDMTVTRVAQKSLTVRLFHNH